MLNKLQNLCGEELAKVREAFTKNSHTCFLKSFSYHFPSGAKEAYIREITNASLERLARLIKICGFLTQAKVYLLWQNTRIQSIVLADYF